MKCPKCGKVARFVGFQCVDKSARPNFKGRSLVKLWQCKDCGSFVDLRDVGEVKK